VAGVAACQLSGGHEELNIARGALDLETEGDLRDAVDLYVRSTVEQYTFATDVGERTETLVGTQFVRILGDNGQFEDIFNIGDEAFEAEHDRYVGFGQGPMPQDISLPALVRRIQDGERGGVDSTSCRSCHFNGGPDGAGTASQTALFRGDGVRLSSSTRRDPPHVMGLGYISQVAREIEDELAYLRDDTVRYSGLIDEPWTQELRSKGISYGRITAHPDGTVDTTQLEGIGADLLVRPFGFKGRHRTLVALADEALQLHHGLQSEARVEMYEGASATYLGPGPDPYDYDNDGVQSEVSAGQSVLAASYLSMLGTPEIRPPKNAELALAWARGKRSFGEVQCNECHKDELRFDSYIREIRALGDTDLQVTIDLREAGQDPIPHNLDVTPGDDGRIPGGIPIYPFTDLKRHDMGPELADARPEVLPDGSGEVPGSVWLTRSLWGVADTAPYLHDGRAPTLHDAIRLHGGEAQDSRDAYMALPEEDRRALRVFLASLTRGGVLLVE
jgi:hypothetical protein